MDQEGRNQQQEEESASVNVSKMLVESFKMLPDRSKTKTDLLYFKAAPIIVMLLRWYGAFQFYGNKMEITLWYEENEEPVWFFYLITYILYPISLWKGLVLHRLCFLWRIPLLYALGVNIIHILYGSIIIKNEMFLADMFLIIIIISIYAYVTVSKLQNHSSRVASPC